MTVRTMPVPLDVGQAVCSDPEHLPLVDAAAAKPGGPEAQIMKATLCRRCPVNQTCHEWAMSHAEAGIWGGTSPGYRGKRGAPRRLAPVEHARTEGIPAQQWRRKARTRRLDGEPESAGRRKQNAAAARCAELGVRESDVRRWAYEQGLVASNKGRVALATVEAYATAHQAA